MRKKAKSILLLLKFSIFIINKYLSKIKLTHTKKKNKVDESPITSKTMCHLIIIIFIVMIEEINFIYRIKKFRRSMKNVDIR